jgi:two-component system phosphate regulon sensor histidine kinase PhoR
MKLIHKILNLKPSSIIWLVIIALMGLIMIQGYLLFIQVDVQRKVFENKLNDILLEVHHSVENDSLSSSVLIELLQKKENNLQVPPGLMQQAKAILLHKIDSVSQEFGVDLKFNYALFHTGTGEFVIASHENITNPQKYYQQSERAGWRVKQSMGKGKYRIGFDYKNEFFFLLQQVKFLLIISAMLIMLLVFSFYVVISGWRRQKQLSELKNDFINNMTHELKTPIFSVALLHNVINKMNGETPARLKKYLELLQNENQKLKERVEKVLDVTLMENNSLPLEFEVYDVHQLIKEACVLTDFLMEQQNSRIIYNFGARQNYCKVDKVHFMGIIHNLVDNAMKYSPAEAHFEIYTINRDQKIIVGVKDNGVGIKDSQMGKVFEKFYRVPTGNIHQVKGLGLGLSYVKMMVEAHHGMVKLVSKPKRGSEFIIELPISEKHETHDIIS